nr:RNA-directed DNA polymerase, eukaryota [Tanacetum cinerariifolium]
YAFTWTHPSATKMSKLDRFLVSEGIIAIFPSITAICLDRHLSDHRPILLNEIHSDFGPILFGFTILGLIKLQDLKKLIRAWIRESNITQAETKNTILKDLVEIDKNLDEGANLDELLPTCADLNHKLYEINQMDLKDVAQKAKIRWAIEGDENSKFFHGVINKRRSQLVIRGVFASDMPFPNRLSLDQVGDLEKDISHEEIRNAIWDCGVSKSPSLDGYTFEFFKHYWSFIGPNLCSAVKCFFDKGCFLRGGNSSFIALIPKVTDAKFVADFRPISLIGSVYKVVTKILANRLAMAYDSVCWDFLLDVLSAFAFGSKWCHWIRGIFSSNMASVLVNGSPEFPIYRGLKQGDPLALFLFILIMESLHLSISRAVNDGIFKGLHIRGSISISHLFYADDVVFIGEWSDQNLDNLLKI